MYALRTLWISEICRILLCVLNANSLAIIQNQLWSPWGLLLRNAFLLRLCWSQKTVAFFVGFFGCCFDGRIIGMPLNPAVTQSCLRQLYDNKASKHFHINRHVQLSNWATRGSSCGAGNGILGR